MCMVVSRLYHIHTPHKLDHTMTSLVELVTFHWKVRIRSDYNVTVYMTIEFTLYTETICVSLSIVTEVCY